MEKVRGVQKRTIAHTRPKQYETTNSKKNPFSCETWAKNGARLANHPIRCNCDEFHCMGSAVVLTIAKPSKVGVNEPSIDSDA